MTEVLALNYKPAGACHTLVECKTTPEEQKAIDAEGAVVSSTAPPY